MNTFLGGRVTIHAGDCREVLPGFEANSFDSCVCDPPYHLASIVKRFGKPGSAEAQFGSDGAYRRATAGFMGKAWDGGDVAFRPETWAEVLRVLKPGAHLLAMGGDRTVHRLACAIEDAGFEIRGHLAWIYGSGFPKNLNVSKKLADSLHADALQACDLCDWQIVQDYQASCSSYRDPDDAQPQSATNTDQDGLLRSADAHEHIRAGRHSDDLDEEQANISFGVANGHHANGDSSRLSEPLQGESPGRDNTRCDTEQSKSLDELTVAHRTDFRKSGKSHSGGGSVAFSSESPGSWFSNLPQCITCGKHGIPAGLGTALKPAMELVVLARKPLSEPTIAANVLRWGTGALNIDGCRVEAALGDKGEWPITARSASRGSMAGPLSAATTDHSRGRWPANVIHDGSEEVLAAFPESSVTGNRSERSQSADVAGTNWLSKNHKSAEHLDSGSAARFFKSCSFTEEEHAKRVWYGSKADADDRTGSRHPTIKPVALIQYLCRLITPPGGKILDCFSGTGTTGEAAWREGFSAVLIERESEYLADIERRMSLCLAGPDERARESIKARLKGKPEDHGPLFSSSGVASTHSPGASDAPELQHHGDAGGADRSDSGTRSGEGWAGEGHSVGDPNAASAQTPPAQEARAAEAANGRDNGGAAAIASGVTEPEIPLGLIRDSALRERERARYRRREAVRG